MGLSHHPLLDHLLIFDLTFEIYMSWRERMCMSFHADQR